jgi:hypothetical protein
MTAPPLTRAKRDELLDLIAFRGWPRSPVEWMVVELMLILESLPVVDS